MDKTTLKLFLEQRKEHSNCYKYDGKFITTREPRTMMRNIKRNETSEGLYGCSSTSTFGSKLKKKRIKEKRLICIINLFKNRLLHDAVGSTVIALTNHNI